VNVQLLTERPEFTQGSDLFVQNLDVLTESLSPPPELACAPRHVPLARVVVDQIEINPQTSGVGIRDARNLGDDIV
jgi:hypothetical protein